MSDEEIPLERFEREHDDECAKRGGLEWEECEARMEDVLKKTFPEMTRLQFVNWLERWLFVQNDLDEYDYQKGCYERALEMFEFEHVGYRERAAQDFGAFIRPAIAAFLEFKPDPDPEKTKLELITEILESEAKGATKLAMVSAVMDNES